MRLIVTLLLMTLTAPAWAEWVKYAETDEVVYYYDPATIKKRGKYVRVWALQDRKQRDKKGVLSARFLANYDCKEDRSQYLNFSLHSHGMGRGNTVLSSDDPDKWRYIPPQSVEARLLRMVCAK